MQKDEFWVKLGSGIFYTPDTYTPTNEKYIPPPSWRQRGGHGGFFFRGCWNTLHWVGVEEWVGRCVLCHTSNSLQGLVQVQRRRVVAKWSGAAASESSNLACKRGRADEMEREACRGLPSFLEKRQQLLPPSFYFLSVYFALQASQFKYWATSE